MQENFTNLTYEDRPYTPKLYTEEEVSAICDKTVDFLYELWMYLRNSSSRNENIKEKAIDIGNECFEMFSSIRLEYNKGGKVPDKKYNTAEKALEFSNICYQLLGIHNFFSKETVEQKRLIKLKKYGQLYIDMTFLISNYPVLFTCIDRNDNIFLCCCCQNDKNGIKSLFGKTDNESIIRMLENKTTIRQVFTDFTTDKICVNYVNGKYEISYDNPNWDMNSSCLPKEDSYMYAEEGEFAEEIEILRNRCKNHRR